MRQAIRFLLGTEARELRGVDPTRTVLEYLRADERRCGTKEGCAEGDCGACTVVLAEPEGAGIRARAVNSCIQFVPTLDGKQLITVEDLRAPDGALHPAQRAMVETNGSQCGFCTPGFVMSLYAMYRNRAPVSRPAIDDALAGNLCRCTGYGPIIAAARRMAELPATAPAVEDEAVLERLRGLECAEPFALEGRGTRYFAPRRAGELAALLLEHPDACLLAGGTDVGLWVTKQHRRLETVIHLGEVAELKRLVEADGTIEIGAAVTYAEAMALVARHYPDFGELIRRLGSVQIRNLGTLGGNVANGSPIGDSPPALIAAGATLVLRRGEARREIALEDFFLDYGVQDRRAGEFVETIRLPVADPARAFRAYKLSKRFDQDISAVCAAFSLKLAGELVEDIRVCYGGMARTVRRAPHCERALIGAPWREDSVRAAMAALERDYAPITDMRAGREYRLQAARNLLFKMYLETSGEGDATRLPGAEALADVG